MVKVKLSKAKGYRFLPTEEKPKNKKRIYAEVDGFNAMNSDSTVKKKKKKMKEMEKQGEKYKFDELIYNQEIHHNSILLDQPMIFKSCKSIQAPNGMNRL
ncbi:late expression factor 5 [Corchorus capsularis]|uniref:Late expression factor 5 n=1 Tax=Corchorus capsularis TaxID=210143 RepID=A0A1R3IZI8_COCAP|nr:late expression factor 5 [Corchorus capsularis]